MIYKKILTIAACLLYSAAVIVAQPAVALAATNDSFYDLNDILFYNPDDCSSSDSGGSTEITGADNREKVWNYLRGQGLSPEQAAGVGGNLELESGLNPGVQNSIGAFGIAQWLGGRKTNLNKKISETAPELSKYINTNSSNIPQSDHDKLLKIELDFLVEESKGRDIPPGVASEFGENGSEWETLKSNTKTIEDATIFWHEAFERSEQSRAEALATRLPKAQKLFSDFAGSSSSSSSTSSSSISTSGAASSSSSLKTVLLDPGHVGSPGEGDNYEGLIIGPDYNNKPENENMFAVAQRAQTKLESKGFNVLLTKNQASDYISLVQRGQMAIDKKVDLAVSLHSTPAAGGALNMTWAQASGEYRQNGSTKVIFDNEEVAAKSKEYATAIAEARKEAEGHDINLDTDGHLMANSFPADRGLSTHGNIAINMLVAGRGGIPWVYNEIEQDAAGGAVSDAMIEKYAEGVANGIEKALGGSSGGGNDRCGNDYGSIGAGNAASVRDTVLKYAWHEYKGDPFLTPTEAYAEAHAIGEVGNTADCGHWVGFVMRKSGLDPEYIPAGTYLQEPYLREHWQRIGIGSEIDTAQLEIGDVAIVNRGNGDASNGHTFLYVGQVSDFQEVIASASLGTRTAMAGQESLTEDGLGRGELQWYRKK